MSAPAKSGAAAPRAWWLYGALALLAVADLAAGAAGMMHGHASPEQIPLFGLAAGLGGALLIAGAAKLLLAPLVGRKEGPDA